MSKKEFSPSQFAQDAGWDFAQILATAAKGVSEVDAETIQAMGFGQDEVAELLAHCKALVAPEITINGQLVQVPEGAVAYKYADPTEGARWVYEQEDLADIRRADPSLIVDCA